MNATETEKHAVVHHHYWLYSDGGGKLGPFTKSEARAIVKESPEVSFRARRDGEVEWIDAAVRLAPKKSLRGLFLSIAFVVVAISLLSYWWSANHPHPGTKASMAHLQPSEAPATSVEKMPVGAQTGPVANVPH